MNTRFSVFFALLAFCSFGAAGCFKAEQCRESHHIKTDVDEIRDDLNAASELKISWRKAADDMSDAAYCLRQI